MDNQSFITLSKFTIEARKSIGAINPARLIKDRDYSDAIFQKIDASDNADLILLGLELRNQLGLLEPEEITAAPAQAEKYMFGARG
ncbi:hypothetical protein MTYP_00343 [Methylophilaceae bacterium]|nr:hypothetical protein MTYP_00343 [Methylophilaceae bacterium]